MREEGEWIKRREAEKRRGAQGSRLARAEKGGNSDRDD